MSFVLLALYSVHHVLLPDRGRRRRAHSQREDADALYEGDRFVLCMGLLLVLAGNPESGVTRRFRPIHRAFYHVMHRGQHVIHGVRSLQHGF